MNNPIIETDLASILSKLDQKLDKLDEKSEKKFDNLAKDLQTGQKEILKEISDVKVSQEKMNGDIKALDTKIEQLDKRIGNVEFTIRGVFIGLLVLILGGFAMFFWKGN